MCGCSKLHKDVAWFRIYESPRVGLIWPGFITIKYGQQYERWFMSSETTVAGRWEIKGDTLILTPYCEYAVWENNPYIDIYSDDTIATVSNIQEQFLIRRNKLINITDYTPIYREWFKTPPVLSGPIIYKLVK